MYRYLNRFLFPKLLFHNHTFHICKCFSLFAEVPKLYFPIFWFRKHVTISDSVLMAFKWFLAMPCIMLTLAVIGFIVGIICVVPGIIIISTNKFRVNKYNTQFEQNEKELQNLNFNTIS